MITCRNGNASYPPFFLFFIHSQISRFFWHALKSEWQTNEVACVFTTFDNCDIYVDLYSALQSHSKQTQPPHFDFMKWTPNTYYQMPKQKACTLIILMYINATWQNIPNGIMSPINQFTTHTQNTRSYKAFRSTASKLLVSTIMANSRGRFYFCVCVCFFIPSSCHELLWFMCGCYCFALNKEENVQTFFVC